MLSVRIAIGSAVRDELVPEQRTILKADQIRPIVEADAESFVFNDRPRDPEIIASAHVMFIAVFLLDVESSKAHHETVP